MTGDTIVDLKNVHIFQQDHLILNDVNVEIHRGEFIYLIGKTGSGKSSFMKTLYGEIKIKEGSGTVAGYDLKKLKQSQIPFLRRKLGIVFQNFELLSDRNVNDNLLFVMKSTGWKEKTKMKEQMQSVLEKVGLGTKGYKFPHELSGGEQQRVVIARALLNSPDLVLADEPTGNLDPITTNEILSLLYEISKSGRAVIMATHDYEHMHKYSSRIMVCENGKIIEKNLLKNDLNF
jgi:cell division transport system ATP-binding protein